MSLSPDPDVWFIESSHGMVTKTSEEGTVPCVVTNPSINVTLYEKDTDVPLKGVYDPSEGYKAPLEDRTYVCRGELNGEVKESQAFYVFSIVGRCLGLRFYLGNKLISRYILTSMCGTESSQKVRPFNSVSAYTQTI